MSSSSIVYNGLPLAAGGDLEVLHCQPEPKLNRSTNLQLTTSTPLAANGCWLLLFIIEGLQDFLIEFQICTSSYRMFHQLESYDISLVFLY